MSREVWVTVARPEIEPPLSVRLTVTGALLPLIVTVPATEAELPAELIELDWNSTRPAPRILLAMVFLISFRSLSDSGLTPPWPSRISKDGMSAERRSELCDGSSATVAFADQFVTSITRLWAILAPGPSTPVFSNSLPFDGPRL